jgi:hypothetical protein
VSRHPRKRRDADIREDWFLYLLSELERIVERDAPEWDGTSVKAALARLTKLTATVHANAFKH